MPYKYTLLATLIGYNKIQEQRFRELKNLIDKKYSKYATFNANGLTPEEKRKIIRDHYLYKNENNPEIKRGYRYWETLDQDENLVRLSLRKKMRFEQTDSGNETEDEAYISDEEDDPDEDENIEFDPFIALSERDQNGHELDTVRVYFGQLPKTETFKKFKRLSRYGKQSRLVLFSHGSIYRVGRMTPTQLATNLFAYGLDQNARNLRISMIACNAGKSYESRRTGEITSFAERFHLALYREFGLKATVSARAGAMKVALQLAGGALDYATFVRMGESQDVSWSALPRKAPGTKFIWSWDGDKQVCRDAYNNPLHL